jgi:Nif-specific regulatory protein
MATGTTIATASAVTDPRFRERGSVRQNRIEAVLCTPIVTDQPLGVIYLQDREQPGAFTDQDRERVELFARHLAPLVERLLLRRRAEVQSDVTRSPRRAIRAEGVVGKGPAIAKVLEQVALVAKHRVSVLITGPTGSGKTQIARVIHENSPRASQPFVELNCAALPGNLLENELFGAMAGAHSTANANRTGKVAAAEGGTLFLDEVAELELAAQSKLLQLLQSGEYFPLGSTQARRADIRVIAATNTNLQEAILQKTFREDLFYRLTVLPIRMPGLAERREDVGHLLLHFVARACEANDLPELQVSPGALRAAELHDWPGNVRQLANVVEAAVLRANLEGTRLEARHLFPEAGSSDADPQALTYEQHFLKFRRELLKKTLAQTDWNVTETARRLDLARSQVHKLISTLGLKRS